MSEIAKRESYTISNDSQVFYLLDSRQRASLKQYLLAGNVASAKRLVNWGVAQTIGLTSVALGGLLAFVYIVLGEVFSEGNFSFTGHTLILDILGAMWGMGTMLFTMAAFKNRSDFNIQPNYNPELSILYKKCLNKLYELEESPIWNNSKDYPEIQRFDIDTVREEAKVLADSVHRSVSEYGLDKEDMEALPDFEQLYELSRTLKGIVATVERIQETLKDDRRRNALKRSTPVTSLEIAKHSLDRNHDYANNLDEVFETQKALETGDDDEQ